jgi:hypothetical protein
MESSFMMVETLWTSSFLQAVTRMKHLLGAVRSMDHLLLNMAKEVLNWVQPGTVLRIEQHVGFQDLAGSQDVLAVMEAGVVHQQDDLP